MLELPALCLRGERARLFPVLADTSKEGRTLSIFLACLENVEEFGRAMLSEVGQRVGSRSRVETYTEVVLKESNEDQTYRPDGLIVVRVGSSQWCALVEAKVGNSELTIEQVENYLDVARRNNVDALITISNQFAPLPSQHPVSVSSTARRKAALYHWSWMFVLTEATLLLNNEEIVDRDQRVILNEMVRFLTHPSAGVQGFDQMPIGWTDVLNIVQTGGSISQASPQTEEVIGAWHQEVRDLSLVLSRQLATDVTIKVPRAQALDPSLRQKADLEKLVTEQCLGATLIIPDAAAPIELRADLQKRSLTVSMRLQAAEERKGTKGRLSLLLRQLQQTEPEGVYIRFFWPWRSAHTQHSLAQLRENPEIAAGDRADMIVSSFEVLIVRDLGARFAQRKNFIVELEKIVPEFYEKVGQRLKAWRPPAPKLSEEKVEPVEVSAEALREQADDVALARKE